VEPALGARAQRALLYNAADITGSRGSLDSIKLLAESLTGFDCTFAVGKNIIGTTDESSFEGLVTDSGGVNVLGGTGRWYFTNSTLSLTDGDVTPKVRIARDANADDTWGPGTRWGLKLKPTITGTMNMSLGEKIPLANYVADANFATITTKWQHGLEAGDKVNLNVNFLGYTNAFVTSVVDPFTVRVPVTGSGAPPPSVTYTANGFFYGGVIPTYQGVLVEPGTGYALVGKFRAANRGDITLSMTFYDKYANSLGTSTVTASGMTPAVTIPASPYTPIYVAATAPAGAEVATLSIDIGSGAPSTYVDVDSLMVAAGGTPFNPNYVVTHKQVVTNVATVTTTVAHGLTTGDGIVVSGMGAPFDGVKALTATPTPFKMSFAATTANIDIDTTGNIGVNYDTSLKYEGTYDYSFEDSGLLTITVNSSLSPNGTAIPVAIQADLIAVLQARLEEILAAYLPIGTAFVVNIV
jgi:hypothetical protein